MEVYVFEYDMDRHGVGCRCGVCNNIGKSYGVAIFDAGLSAPEAYRADPLDVVYGPSYETAAIGARIKAREQGWRIVPKPYVHGDYGEDV